MAVIGIIIFLLGICIGSFLNVLIDRLPNGQNVISGRSRCDWCRKTLRWFELIPVFSFVFQGGKCWRCHRKLSFQYPIIEIVTGFIFLVSYVQFPASPLQAFLHAFFLSALVVLFVADLKYTILPDAVVIGAGTAALAGLFLHGGLDSIIGHFSTAVLAGAGFFTLWSITKGKGLGMGDVKLAFVLGLELGYPYILVNLYTGFLTGAVAGVILILSKRKTVKSHIAFGPFLILGYAITALWGEKILMFWMQYLP